MIVIIIIIVIIHGRKTVFSVRLDSKREDLPLSAVHSFLLISTFHGGVPFREIYFSLLKDKQWLDWSGSGQGQVAGTCKRGNELLGSI